MIDVAVVGTGGLGSRHAANFAQIDGCRVKRVYDIVAENAENCAEPLGAEVARDFDQCLADDIDAVVVVTPTDVHAQYCIKAAQAGKHIFCEKPMARTLDEADQVVEAVEAAGVKMMVGHVLRFFPEYQTARQMVQEGQLGDVGMIRMARINLMPDGWYADLQRSGGVILDMIIHDFDWLLWTLGPPERVYAHGLYEQLPALDYALCTFRFPQGTVAFVEGSWADATGFRTSFEIAGSGGLLAHDSTESTTLIAQRRCGDEVDESAYLPMTPTTKS
ncbi:MAG: Gfo/Idh/MocA family oxidoreductase, partial [Armatimonadetes bacterium]|nr:Gfo/Idh/MocA family oxidoreductase [Armatimonadota bacterium]